MSEHVQIDAGKPTCLGVHYAVSPAAAEAHFAAAGFKGISGMRVFERAENCNEARRRALSAARAGEGKCFWEGAWDYSANACQIYAFEYTSYDGPMIDGGSDEVKLHADWSGRK